MQLKLKETRARWVGVNLNNLPINIPKNKTQQRLENYSEPTKIQVPLFMGKIIQMFDVFNIRFGATLVGPTGAGKTTCYRMLAAVMTDLRNKGSVNPEFQVTFMRRRFDLRCILCWAVFYIKLP